MHIESPVTHTTGSFRKDSAQESRTPSGGFFRRLDETTPVSVKVGSLFGILSAVVGVVIWFTSIRSDLTVQMKDIQSNMATQAATMQSSADHRQAEDESRITVLETQSKTTERDLGDIKNGMQKLNDKVDHETQKLNDKLDHLLEKVSSSK